MREQIYRFRVEYIYKMTSYDGLVSEHDDIVKAMIQRKGKDASKIAREHIENQERSVLEFFKANE